MKNEQKTRAPRGIHFAGSKLSEPEHKVNESVGKHKSFECENQLKHNSE